MIFDPRPKGVGPPFTLTFMQLRRLGKGRAGLLLLVLGQTGGRSADIACGRRRHAGPARAQSGGILRSVTREGEAKEALIGSNRARPRKMGHQDFVISVAGRA